MTESVLVATLGAEPQVVTLTLDALLARNVHISRLIVVHTHPDLEPVKTSLTVLEREIQIQRHYGNDLLFMPHLLTGSSGPLADVVSSRDIDDAFHSIYTLLRQNKLAGRTIHLSIAGGRKTMSLFAMAAAQILFGTDDFVWHLLSPPHVIASKALHVTDKESVSLIRVPIARWGHIRPEDISFVRDFVERILTSAEQEVTILLIREGLSNADLAARLGKSTKTIANQLSSVYAKLADYFELANPPDRTTLLVLLGSYS